MSEQPAKKIARGEAAEPSRSVTLSSETKPQSDGEAAPAPKSVQAAEYHDHDFDWEDLLPMGRAYDERLQAWTADRGKSQSDVKASSPEGKSLVAKASSPAKSDCTPIDDSSKEESSNCAAVADLHPMTSNEAVGTSWEKFHARNQGQFFKRRRYLTLAFPGLMALQTNATDPSSSEDDSAGDDGSPLVVELGCGCGSTILTLLLSNPHIRAIAVDISASAIDRLNSLLVEHKLEHRCKTAVVDIAEGVAKEQTAACTDDPKSTVAVSLTSVVPNSRADGILMLFALSALRPTQHDVVVRECARICSQGGRVYFRDYGLYDLKMMRCPLEQHIEGRLYFRGDGTLAFYFDLEYTKRLFEGNGFKTTELKYCTVRSINRKKKQVMDRVFIQGVFERV